MSSEQKNNSSHHDLNSMSDALAHLWNRIPLTFKIMLWYSLFLGVLIISMSVFYYNYINSSDAAEIRNRLQQQTLVMSTNMRKFTPYQEGTFFLVYTQDGVILKGYIPDSFPNQSNLSLGQVSELEANGVTFYYYDVPISTADYKGFLRAITSQKVTDKRANTIYALVLVSVIALLISSVGGYLFVKQGLKPLRKLTQTARIIARNNDLSRRIELPDIAKDEVYELTTTFNRMLSGLENSSNREKQFNSDVSHELRTPISIIQAESEYGLKYAKTPEEMREGMTHIFEQAKFMSSLVSQLLDVARLENSYELDIAPVDVTSLLNNMVHHYRRLCADKNITIKSSISDNLTILGHEISLRRAVSNLIDNAVKFTHSTIEITAKQNNFYLVIEITDDGIGIEEEHLKQIFNRMYQTEQSRNKKSNHGIGLGLYFVDKVVHLHHGTIVANSKPNVFTTFTITLPLQDVPERDSIDLL
ncbi:sensor histidine kinase [Veillonella agrestimuris]|uniref:sensor histidine kinase n=1 Tax=Veillonella agrestimuris TaxID=2941340 RepID=UPI002041FB6B|nr:HAMP domain-containing sensor histidine kinase [Veillonella agrestimuris]